MSLCPSNMIAQEMNPGAKVFPNLARHIDAFSQEDAEKVFSEVDAIVRAELEQAGATDSNCLNLNFRSLAGEVPTKYIGFAHGWKFQRAWYYYVASGPGIPPNQAEEFHQKWGTQVRVEGHCGCPSPIEYCHGFAVGSYHIDTQEGLNAFVKLLAEIDTRKRKPEASGAPEKVSG